MAQQKLAFNKVIKFLDNKKPQLIIQLLLVLIIILNVGATVWNLREKYMSSDYWKKFPALEKIFRDSQYMNKHPKGFIPDEIAMSYAGGKLIQGTNPILVVPEAPPLGKYLVGISTVIFNNDSTIILISAILSLILLFILSLQVLGNKTLALLPSALFSFEPIFNNQLRYTPLMDIFQLVFLIGCFYFFNKSLSSKKIFFSLFTSCVFLGLFISTKFFVSGLSIVAAFYLILFLHKDKKRLIHLTLSLPISVFILLFSYARVFAFGYNIPHFLGIQKWILLYHKSQLILPFSVWPLLLIDRWYVWFGNKPYIPDPQWFITWPIITIISITTIVLYLLKRIERNTNVEVLMAWFIFYMLLFSVGQIFSRYFVIMIPILYIISIYGVISVLRLKLKK